MKICAAGKYAIEICVIVEKCLRVYYIQCVAACQTGCSTCSTANECDGVQYCNAATYIGPGFDIVNDLCICTYAALFSHVCVRMLLCITSVCVCAYVVLFPLKLPCWSLVDV